MTIGFFFREGENNTRNWAIKMANLEKTTATKTRADPLVRRYSIDIANDVKG